MATTRGEELEASDLHAVRRWDSLAIRYTWIRPEISMTASTMLIKEVDEQNTDHNKATVPGSLAGGTCGSAQQTWGNWLEANPQQMQENRNSG